MAKEIKVKSNGLRNELKEIRRSIDRLTEVLIQFHLTNAPTDYEKSPNHSASTNGNTSNGNNAKKED